MASVFDSYAPMKGEIQRRTTGSLVAFETGEAVTYGLFNAQERGALFIGAGTPVYAGMVVGETPKAGGHLRQRVQEEAADQHAGLRLRRGPAPDPAPPDVAWSSAWSSWLTTSCWSAPRRTSGCASASWTTATG